MTGAGCVHTLRRGMRDAWIYGDGPMGAQVARMLAELGFGPRRVPGGGELRPPLAGSQPCHPALVLMLVCEADGTPRPDELLRRLRADVDLCDVPLVVAIDAGRAGSWVSALDADEIILQPLRIEELGVRIARARSQHGIVTQDLIRLGSLAIDLAAYEVRLDGAALELTHMEYRLLELLATHPRRVYSRERLLSRMWGRDHAASARTVDGHVGRLRAKLGPEHGHRICTVRNVGYRFEP
jgi:DNA-binding response OmpR family regulator